MSMIIISPKWLNKWEPGEEWLKKWHVGEGPVPLLSYAQKKELLNKFGTQYKDIVEKNEIPLEELTDDFLAAPIRSIEREDFVKSFTHGLDTQLLIGDQKIAFVYDQTRGECHYVIILDDVSCVLSTEANVLKRAEKRRDDIVTHFLEDARKGRRSPESESCLDELAVLYLLYRWKEYEKYRKELNDQKYYKISLKYGSETRSTQSENKLVVSANKIHLNHSEAGINRVISGVRPSGAFISYLKGNGRTNADKLRNSGFTVSHYTDGYDFSEGVSKILADMALISVIMAHAVRNSMEELNKGFEKKFRDDVRNEAPLSRKIQDNYDPKMWQNFYDHIVGSGSVSPFTIREEVDVGYLLSDSDVPKRELSLSVRSVHRPSSCIKSSWIVIVSLFHQLTHLLVGKRGDDRYEFLGYGRNPKSPEALHTHHQRFYQTFSWLINVGVDEKILPPEFKGVDASHMHSLLYLPQRYLTRCVPTTSAFYLEEYYLKDPNEPSLKSIISEGRGVFWGNFTIPTEEYEPLKDSDDQKKHLWGFNHLALSKETIIRVFIPPKGEIIVGPTREFLKYWQTSSFPDWSGTLFDWFRYLYGGDGNLSKDPFENKVEKYYHYKNLTETLENTKKFQNKKMAN